MAKRSYPTSRVPGCNGAVTSKTSYPTSEVRGSSQEELLHVLGQGRQLRAPGCDSTGAAERSYPTSKVRGSSWEEQPHVQGVVAVWVQEGLEELFHVQGQERRQGGDNPFPR